MGSLYLGSLSGTARSRRVHEKDFKFVMRETSSSKSRRSASQARKNARTGARVNRSQLRAMEVRSVETGHTSQVASVATTRTGRPRPVARSVVLSKAAEMRYQRNDLRRLLYTAGALFVLMVALLIVLD